LWRVDISRLAPWRTCERMQSTHMPAGLGGMPVPHMQHSTCPGACAWTPNIAAAGNVSSGGESAVDGLAVLAGGGAARGGRQLRRGAVGASAKNACAGGVASGRRGVGVRAAWGVGEAAAGSKKSAAEAKRVARQMPGRQTPVKIDRDGHVAVHDWSIKIAADSNTH